ncbi:MAG: hypothetical protein OSB43_12715 [Nocardioides sp.]|uniref:hypothetical protein n=1 Tax=Nocardioides sp. TaxID=35761 RepID=UPI002395FBAE|nr:hypothetical protein [Nocardioides sp.]MDE0777127.1 hypothetical protein [Nocardioides sp.]
MSSRTTSTTPTPAGNLARIAVLVVIAAVAATAVWLGTRGDDGAADRDGGTEPAAGTSGDSPGGSAGGSGSELLAPESVAAAPAEGVTMPTGSTQTDGYATGFPYTDLGAVALQVELARAQVGLDYDQAATVAQLYSDPADQAVFEQRSRDAVGLRRQQAGVPAEGEVPAPASYAVTPMAYTLEELDTDYYVVNLLSYVTLTDVDGESRDGLYAGTQLVRWVAEPDAANGGDWKVVEGSTADLENLIAQGQPKAVAPETKEFEDAGWIMIDPTGGTSSAEAGESS